jgi:anti-sigma factor RsiW
VTAACHDLRHLLAAHVLGALDADEAAAVRAHVAMCPDCAAEHTRLAPLPGLLTLASYADAAAAEPPPAALEERLLDAVAREAPRRRRRRLPRLSRPVLLRSAAAGAALAALLVAVLLIGGGGDEGGGGAPAAGYPIRFQAAAAAPTAGGRAELHGRPDGTEVHLWVRGLPADGVYEVHCDAPGWSASAGTFRVGSDGKAYVVLTTAALRGQYDAIRVVRTDDDRVVLRATLN